VSRAAAVPSGGEDIVSTAGAVETFGPEGPTHGGIQVKPFVTEVFNLRAGTRRVA
jgi:hypothetical protein